jgi:Hsp70 protein
MVNDSQVPAEFDQLVMTNTFPRKYASIILLSLASLALAITLAALNRPSPTSETATSGYSGSVIGIDLGTTYTRVAVYKNDTVHVLVNDQGERSTPSWVSFSGDGKTLCVVRSSFIRCGP